MNLYGGVPSSDPILIPMQMDLSSVMPSLNSLRFANSEPIAYFHLSLIS